MSDLIECDVIQIIEPNQDFLIDTAGTTSDLDERGEVELHTGQTSVIVYFQVPKLNVSYNFEYLYVDAEGVRQPGTVIPVPTVRSVEGFACVLVGAVPPPDALGYPYVLHWRVTIVRTSSLVQIDAPENLNLQMPRTNLMAVTFANPRSGTNYGFSELRVENLHTPPAQQAIIRVQVYQKTISGFLIAVNPTPTNDFYFLRVRTP